MDISMHLNNVTEKVPFRSLDEIAMGIYFLMEINLKYSVY